MKVLNKYTMLKKFFFYFLLILISLILMIILIIIRLSIFYIKCIINLYK